MSLDSEIEEMVKTLEPPMEKNLNTAVRTFFMSQDNESSLARCCHACPVCHAMCLKEYGHLDKHDGHHQPLGLAGISGIGFTFGPDVIPGLLRMSVTDSPYLCRPHPWAQT